ncbi:hypothetical protein BDF21DRAFT_341473, partial [Thamnidium elegans]
SIETARRKKDAIFCSIFDMNMVDGTCKLNIYNQTADNTFTRNEVRAYFGGKNTKVISSEPKKLTYLENILQNGNIVKEAQMPLENLCSEVESLTQEIKEFDGRFKRLMNFQKEKIFCKS